VGAIINGLVALVTDKLQGKSGTELWVDVVMSTAFGALTAGFGGLAARSLATTFASSIVRFGLARFIIPLVKAIIGTASFVIQFYAVQASKGVTWEKMERPPLWQVSLIFFANLILEFVFFLPGINGALNRATQNSVTPEIYEAMRRCGFSDVFQVLDFAGSGSLKNLTFGISQEMIDAFKNEAAAELSVIANVPNLGLKLVDATLDALNAFLQAMAQYRVTN
jgi:hypothetical protein